MKTTTAENIRKELKALADPKYRKFHSYLLPGTDNILGVRIPQLRTMAKEIIKKDDWRPFVETANTNYYEEMIIKRSYGIRNGTFSRSMRRSKDRDNRSRDSGGNCGGKRDF